MCRQSNVSQRKMEWIIVDDGTDAIEDMVSDHPLVSYFKFDKKMSLGRKRNIMHKKRADPSLSIWTMTIIIRLNGYRML